MAAGGDGLGGTQIPRGVGGMSIRGATSRCWGPTEPQQRRLTAVARGGGRRQFWTVKPPPVGPRLGIAAA